MSKSYVMDACALIAFLRNEPGADIVTDLLRDAEVGHITVYMNRLNLLEVYYDAYRVDGKQNADIEQKLIQKLPITIRAGLSDATFLEAGRMKASYKMSLADAVAVAEASALGATLITADYEFDVVEKQERITFQWIRPQKWKGG